MAKKPKPTAKKAPPKSKGGADKQTLFKTEYIEQAGKLAICGWTILEIADFFGIRDFTFRKWMVKYPKLAAAMLINQEAANHRVELSLYQQAMGFERDEEEIKVIDGKVVRVKVRKFYPPNSSAAIYWTKVKMKWRDNAPLDDNPIGPQDDGATTIDQNSESDRQLARRLGFILYKQRLVAND